MLIGLKTPTKEIVNSGTIKRLPGSGQHALQLQIILDNPGD